MFVSYAQNFEDVMLWRALGHVENGFYIDIGAQDPIVDSVSLAFYEKGWRGIHVEPTVHYAMLLRRHRPEDVVLQAAVSDRPGVMKLFEIPDTGLSTLDSDIAERHKRHGFPVHETTTPILTLGALLDEAAAREVHWLKIDVEGFEEQALRGWGDSPVRPWVVVVESTLPLTREEAYAAWEPLLLGRGYSFAYFDGLNRYYVSSNHLALADAFAIPPNVFDDFAYGTTTSHVQRVIVGQHRAQLAAVEQQNLEAVAEAVRSMKAARAELAQAVSQSDERERLAKIAFEEAERAHDFDRAAIEEELTESRDSLLQKTRDFAERESAVADQHENLLREAARELATLEREHRDHADAWHRTHTEHRAAADAAHLARENRLHREVDQMRTIARRLSDELNALEQSWVWRLTHPFGRPRDRPESLLTAGPDIAMSTATENLSPSHDAHMTQDRHTHQAVASVEELLTLNDTTFARSAYVAILGRHADPGGLSSLVEQLRSGVDKEQILVSLATSSEGKLVDPQSVVSGLSVFVERARRNRPSMMKRMIRRLAMGALRPLSNQVRNIDSRLRELADSTDSRLDGLEALLRGSTGSPGGRFVQTPADRLELERMSPHGRDIFFQLRDAAARQARISAP